MVRANTTAPSRVKQHAVPVVLQNLPPAETVNQLVDNLNYLSLVMDEAFSSIEFKLNAERSKIDSIASRVSKASIQTDLIAKHPNKATTVYSSSVYPHSNDELSKPHEQSLINTIDPVDEIPRARYKLTATQRLQRPEPSDTLKLFARLSERTKYVPNASSASSASMNASNACKGLGSLPSQIASVSDCLLFNTHQNPYVKYAHFDNLRGSKASHAKTRDLKASQDSQRLQLLGADAPARLVEKIGLWQGKSFEYDVRYKPEMRNVPKFKVSKTLDGIQNVASDIAWQGTKSSSNVRIAPSCVEIEDLPKLYVQEGLVPSLDQLGDLDHVQFEDFGDLEDADKFDEKVHASDVHVSHMPQVLQLQEKMNEVYVGSVEPGEELNFPENLKKREEKCTRDVVTQNVEGYDGHSANISDVNVVQVSDVVVRKDDEMGAVLAPQVHEVDAAVDCVRVGRADPAQVSEFSESKPLREVNDKNGKIAGRPALTFLEEIRLQQGKKLKDASKRELKEEKNEKKKSLMDILISEVQAREAAMCGENESDSSDGSDSGWKSE